MFVGKCDHDWYEFKGHCYRFYEHYRTYEMAEEWCRRNDSHLLTIHSKAENDFVVSQVSIICFINRS